MVGTFGGRESALLIEAGSTVELVRDALLALLAASGWRNGEWLATGRVATARGEAGDVPGLVGALWDDLVDQIESLEIAVAGLELGGLLRSDGGVIAWVTVEIGDGGPETFVPRRLERAELIGQHALRIVLG